MTGVQTCALPISNIAPVVEAGGDCAVYFDPYNMREAFTLIRSFANDGAALEARWALIRNNLPTRSWGEVAEDVEQQLRRQAIAVSTVRVAPVALQQAEFHSIGACSGNSLDSKNINISSSKDILGNGWSQLEPWGVWAVSSMARIAFKIADWSGEDIQVYIEAISPPWMEGAPAHVRSKCGSEGKVRFLHAVKPTYLPIVVRPNHEGIVDITLHTGGFRSSPEDDARPLHVGLKGLICYEVNDATLELKAVREMIFER